MYHSKGPSAFAEWMFSNIGKADWPKVKLDDIRQPRPPKQKIGVTTPQRPLNVTFAPEDMCGDQGHLNRYYSR